MLACVLLLPASPIPNPFAPTNNIVRSLNPAKREDKNDREERQRQVTGWRKHAGKQGGRARETGQEETQETGYNKYILVGILKTATSRCQLRISMRFYNLL